MSLSIAMIGDYVSAQSKYSPQSISSVRKANISKKNFKAQIASSKKRRRNIRFFTSYLPSCKKNNRKEDAI